jgi:hypothetical protein
MSFFVNPVRARRAAVVACLVLGAGAASSAATFPDNPSENLPIAMKVGSQTVEKAATLADGTTWVGWFDNDGTGFKLFVQRLSPAGEFAFDAAGLLVSDAPQSTSLVDWDLIADADGACVVVFTDTRGGADLDVIAQRILPNGTMQWGEDGKQISTNDDFEAAPRVSQDASTGEYHISWLRSDANRGIYYQRLNTAGVEQVAAGGVRIAGDGTEGPGFHHVVSPTTGGFIMVYVRDTRTFQSPRHVYAQRYDTSGAAMWNGGAPVVISDASPIPIAQYPQIALAPDNGAAFAWSDFRDGDSDVYAQRVDENGAIQFAANGVTASIRAGRQQFEPAIAFIDDTLEFLCFFNDRNGSQSLRSIGVQRFDAMGGRGIGDIPTDVLQFNNQNKSAPRAVPAPGGAVMAVGVEPASAQGNFNANIVAVRVNDRGGALWQMQGGTVTASDFPSGKSRLLATIDSNTVTRLFWEDARNGDGDIYGQNINADGTLGAEAVCPGDTNGDNIINFTDLNIVLSNFGQSGVGIPGDINGDGAVNFTDLNGVLSAFGQDCI